MLIYLNIITKNYSLQHFHAVNYAKHVGWNGLADDSHVAYQARQVLQCSKSHTKLKEIIFGTTSILGMRQPSWMC